MTAVTLDRRLLTPMNKGAEGAGVFCFLSIFRIDRANALVG